MANDLLKNVINRGLVTVAGLGSNSCIYIYIIYIPQTPVIPSFNMTFLVTRLLSQVLITDIRPERSVMDAMTLAPERWFISPGREDQGVIACHVRKR